MHAYAAHYARQMWPGTAKKMGMGERHLVVHYRVGDVAVGPVLAPGSLVAAIKALSPAPRVVEILSGGVKHDTECAEAMEAYLERIKVQQRLEGVLGELPDLAVRIEATRADPNPTPNPNPGPTPTPTPTPSPTPSPTPTLTGAPRARARRTATSRTGASAPGLGLGLGMSSWVRVRVRHELLGYPDPSPNPNRNSSRNLRVVHEARELRMPRLAPVVEGG